jgi:hypothetical protein
MKIIIKAENKKEEKVLGGKEVGYEGVTDFYLDVRWLEGKVLFKSESRSYGDLLYLLGRMYAADFQLKEAFKNGSSK